ncbi:hypothetical protein HDV01_004160 [Terramyces sp. JEL0728]|nr:hypothetical protein HDV01_004160 [Terramyces sp. JEL0728]
MKLHWLVVAQALANKKKTCPIPTDDYFVIVYGEKVKDLPCGSTLCLNFMGSSFNVQAYKENAYCNSDLCTDLDSFLYYFSDDNNEKSSVIEWKIGSCDESGSGTVSRLFPMGGSPKPPPVQTTQIAPQIGGGQGGVIIDTITRPQLHPGGSFRTAPGSLQPTAAAQVDFLAGPSALPAMNVGPTPVPAAVGEPGQSPLSQLNAANSVSTGSIPSSLAPGITNLTDLGAKASQTDSNTAAVTNTKSNAQGIPY